MFPVTLRESGLPAGTTWSAAVANQTATSSTASINFSEPNGSWPVVFFAVNGTPGFAPPWTTLDHVVVNGGPVQFSISYVHRVAVRFVSVGLPTASPWSVQLTYWGGCSAPYPCYQNSSGITAGARGNITVYVPRGLPFHYAFAAPGGYGLARMPGSTDCGVAAPLGAQHLLAYFGRAETVYFNESIIPGWPGLPAGSGWSVTLVPTGHSCGPGGVAYNVTTPSGGSVNFTIYAGEHYRFLVSTGAGNYVAGPSHGAFVAGPAILAKAVKFHWVALPPLAPAFLLAGRLT